MDDLRKLQEIIDSDDPVAAKKKLQDLMEDGDISEEIKDQIRALLYGSGPFLGTHDKTTNTYLAVAFVLIIALVIFFFGYKLFKSIKEKEKKKEEKKKAKMSKKKK